MLTAVMQGKNHTTVTEFRCAVAFWLSRRPPPFGSIYSNPRSGCLRRFVRVVSFVLGLLLITGYLIWVMVSL